MRVQHGRRIHGGAGHGGRPGDEEHSRDHSITVVDSNGRFYTRTEQESSRRIQKAMSHTQFSAPELKIDAPHCP